MKEKGTHIVGGMREIRAGRTENRGRGLYLVILRRFLSRRWRQWLVSSTLVPPSEKEERHDRKYNKRHNTSYHTYTKSTKVVTRQSSRVPLANQGRIELTTDDSCGISFTTGSGIGRIRGRTRRSQRGRAGSRGERASARGNRAGSRTDRDRGDWIWCRLRVPYPTTALGNKSEDRMKDQTYDQWPQRQYRCRFVPGDS